MENKTKAKIVFEIDRSEYDACLFLMGQKKSEETEAVWNAMIGEPIQADTSSLEEEERTFKIGLIALAVNSVEDRIKHGTGGD